VGKFSSGVGGVWTLVLLPACCWTTVGLCLALAQAPFKTYVCSAIRDGKGYCYSCSLAVPALYFLPLVRSYWILLALGSRADRLSDWHATNVSFHHQPLAIYLLFVSIAASKCDPHAPFVPGQEDLAPTSKLYDTLCKSFFYHPTLPTSLVL